MQSYAVSRSISNPPIGSPVMSTLNDHRSRSRNVAANSANSGLSSTCRMCTRSVMLYRSARADKYSHHEISVLISNGYTYRQIRLYQHNTTGSGILSFSEAHSTRHRVDSYFIYDITSSGETAWARAPVSRRRVTHDR
jgi:hypothetical protein